jgi:Flp pilus assembly protein TadB
MIPRRWHHGHSLGAGVLVGLGLASVWTLLVLAFFVGAIAVLSALGLRWLVLVLRSRRRVYR